MRGVRAVTMDFSPVVPVSPATAHVPKPSLDFHRVPPPSSLAAAGLEGNLQIAGLGSQPDATTTAFSQAMPVKADAASLTTELDMQSFDGLSSADHGVAASSHQSISSAVISDDDSRQAALAQTLVDIALLAQSTADTDTKDPNDTS
jgi:hypothetical protein